MDETKDNAQKPKKNAHQKRRSDCKFTEYANKQQ